VAYAHTSTARLPACLPEVRLLEVQASTENTTSVMATVDYNSGSQLVIQLGTDRSGSWRVVTVLTALAGG
jgi:hypothetical protein